MTEVELEMLRANLQLMIRQSQHFPVITMSIDVDKAIAQAKLANKSGGAEAVAEIVMFGTIKECSWREGKMSPVGTLLYAHPSVAGMPDEPTEEMLDAAIAWRNSFEVSDKEPSMRDQFRSAYKAMHSAYVRALGGA